LRLRAEDISALCKSGIVCRLPLKSTANLFFAVAITGGVNLIDTAAMYATAKKRLAVLFTAGGKIPDLHKMRTMSSAQAQSEWILYAPCSASCAFDGVGGGVRVLDWQSTRDRWASIGACTA